MARRIIGGLATVALALGLLGLGSMQRVTTQDRRFDPTRAELESLRRENDALRKQLRQSQTLGRGCSASTTVAPLTTLAPSAIVAAAATGRSYVYSPSNIPYASNDLVMMTYATGGVAEMLRNWVRHVERVKTQGILVAAMDHAVTAQCTEQRFDCLDWSTTAVEKDTQYVRGDFAGFRALGVRKLDALLAVLSRGVHVVLSDVDCVWSASPEALVRGHTPGFQAFADADVLVATDCMSPELDASGDGCYNELMDKNTGVLAVRATADGIATMREWRQRIALAQKDEQDQTTFMDLMDSNGRGHRWGMDATARREWAAFASTWCKSAGFSRARSTRGIYQKLAPKGGGGGGGESSGSSVGRSIFKVCWPNITSTLKVGVFPITEVAGGHTFFIQQLQTPSARWPMAVHATYQYGDTKDFPFGKRQRFRDWGMWLADEPSEMVGDGQYLVLEDDEPVAPSNAWIGDADLHVRGRQHVHHLEYTRQRLARGVALARALNRTVVLPTLWCYCDKFWHRLDQCAIHGATKSQLLPFKCPLDHVIDPSLWHGTDKSRRSRPRPGMLAARVDGKWEEGVPFRGSYWLRTLGAHPGVGMSTARLTAKPLDANETARLFHPPDALLDSTASHSSEEDKAEARRKVQHRLVSGDEGPRLVLPPGQSDVQLRKQLAQYAHIKLLRVTLSSANALLGCLADKRDTDQLRRLTDFIFQHKWCYRPKEMLPEWKDMSQWCVWGFKTPTVPDTCRLDATA